MRATIGLPDGPLGSGAPTVSWAFGAHFSPFFIGLPNCHFDNGKPTVNWPFWDPPLARVAPPNADLTAGSHCQMAIWPPPPRGPPNAPLTEASHCQMAIRCPPPLDSLAFLEMPPGALQ